MSRPRSCKECGRECEAYKRALREAVDEMDVYLARNTVQDGCRFEDYRLPEEVTDEETDEEQGEN